MRGTLPLALGLLLATAAAAPAARAQVSPDTLVHYALLHPDSGFLWGCFPPCECPVLVQATLDGTFTLQRTSTDPVTLTTTYALTDVRWTTPTATQVTAVTGSGTYTLVAGSAPTDRLTLDLSFDGGPVQHFDSGAVADTLTFPVIRATVSLHGEFCHDSVLVVAAKPASTAGLGSGGAAASLAAFPNPFAAATTLRLSLPRAAAVTLAIYDVTGRRVRVLARGEWMEAGPATRDWDGRRDDGGSAPAGLYLARLDWGAAHAVRPVVKLRD